MAMVEAPTNCPDCDAAPGHTHEEGCDVERCSYCGQQRISCGHAEHDPRKAFWTGYWPGDETCRMFHTDPNGLALILAVRHTTLADRIRSVR